VDHSRRAPAYGFDELDQDITIRSTVSPTERTHVWNFESASVELPERLTMPSMMMPITSQSLHQPQLLGAGGGGAVFRMTTTTSLHDEEGARCRDEEADADVALKISWVASADSVANACRLLQILEQKQVHGVERCLGMEPYPSDQRRVMIALQPVVTDQVSSIADLPNELRQTIATEQLMQTLVEMLAAQVVTTDVQLLVSSSGDILLIDLTEAKLLLTASPPSLLDLSLAGSFCSEMMSLVPESMHQVAINALTLQLKSHPLTDDLYDILSAQMESLTL
jgi:hypothetical protein